MRRKIERFNLRLVLFVINHFLCGTHFFWIKRHLLNSLRDVHVGEGVKIVGPIYFNSGLSIKSNCWIGRNFSVEGNGKAIIDSDVNIAPNVVFYTGTHEIGTCDCRAGLGYSGTVTIEKGCWICGSVIILPDTVVGHGTVVAAGSVVNKSQPSNVLVAGNPAAIKRELQ